MIRLFIPGNPKNANSPTQHRMATARDRKKFRTLAAKVAGEFHWPGGAVPAFVRITARQVSPVNRRRDPGGVAERLKPLLDGVVDSGLLVDDNEDLIQLVIARSLVVKGHPPGIELVLEEADPPWAEPSSKGSSSPSPVPA